MRNKSQKQIEDEQGEGLTRYAVTTYRVVSHEATVMVSADSRENACAVVEAMDDRELEWFEEWVDVSDKETWAIECPAPERKTTRRKNTNHA